MYKMVLSFALLAASNFSLANPLILDTSGDTTSVYTLYGGAGVGVASGLEVNLVIDGLALKATTESDNLFSKVIIPSNFVNKNITKAEIKKWMSGGKNYQCTADNLPLVVMQGDNFNSSTQIHFVCSPS